MNKLKLISFLAGMLSLIICSTAHASLTGNAILDFTDGAESCQSGGVFPNCDFGATTVLIGSYFAMDLTNVGVFDETERVALENAGTGLTLGAAQVAGAIDLDWSFGGNLGRHLTKNALTFTQTGVNTYSIDMTGWTINWGNEGDVDMGTGADATLICSVDCAVDDTFVLDYTAVVPAGSYNSINYQLHLEGKISAVPLLPAVWLFGSGLIVLIGVVRRKQG